MKHDSGSLSSIFKEIKKDIDNSKSEMFVNLKEHISKDERSLKSELKKDYEESIRKGKERIRSEIKELIEKAELDGERKLLEKRNMIVKECTESVNEKLKSFSKTKEYAKLLRKLLKNSSVLGKKRIIHCSKSDAKSIKKSRSISKIIVDDSISYGIIAYDEHKEKRLDLTIENAIEENQEKIAEIILEEVEK